MKTSEIRPIIKKLNKKYRLVRKKGTSWVFACGKTKFIKVSLLPETGKWNVFCWTKKVSKVRENGSWKTKVTSDSGSFFMWKKGRPLVLKRSTNKLVNTTYVVPTDNIFRLFLNLNNMKIEDYNTIICPLLKDFPEAHVCPAMKYDNLKEVWDYYRVRGAKLRSWIQTEILLKSPTTVYPHNYLNYLLKSLRHLSKVDVNYIQEYRAELIQVSEYLAKTRRCNNNRAFLSLMRYMKKERTRFTNIYLNDILRIEKFIKEKDPTFKFPKIVDIEEYHDALSLKQQELNTKDFHTPYKEDPLTKDLDGLKIGNYTIVTPKAKKDLAEWGTLQKHCIGGYTVTERCKLFALKRDTGEIESCLQFAQEGRHFYEGVLLEPKEPNFRLVQHRGKRNADPKEDTKICEDYILNHINSVIKNQKEEKIEVCTN